MNTVRFLTIVLLIFSISCERDNYLTKNEINFGDYSNMIVKYYDTILVGGYHNSQNLDIDINNDNIKVLGGIVEDGAKVGWRYPRLVRPAPPKEQRSTQSSLATAELQVRMVMATMEG